MRLSVDLVSTIAKGRNLIALDETIVKANRKRYCVYAAIDVVKNELILRSVCILRETGS